MKTGDRVRYRAYGHTGTVLEVELRDSEEWSRFRFDSDGEERWLPSSALDLLD